MVQLELQPRMAVAREREKVAQPVRFRIGHRTYTQYTGNIALHLLRRLLQVIGGTQNELRAHQQVAAGVGQLHAAGCALEQPHAKLAFQRLDVTTDRRLAQRQPLGGARQVPLFGHRCEGSKLIQLHRNSCLFGGHTIAIALCGNELES